MSKTCSKSIKEVIRVSFVAIVLKYFSLNLNKFFSYRERRFTSNHTYKLENRNAHVIEIADTDGHIGFDWWFHFRWWDVYFIILAVWLLCSWFWKKDLLTKILLWQNKSEQGPTKIWIWQVKWPTPLLSITFTQLWKNTPLAEKYFFKKHQFVSCCKRNVNQ